MPQIFQVLRCYKCLVFQVHQTKKSNKFQCKLCGEKQSIKRHYGIGTAKDCRLHVQKLNGIRDEVYYLEQSKVSESDEENELINNEAHSKTNNAQSRKSKWSNYVDQNEEEVKQLDPESETMYLNNTEVVLEVPKKRRKSNFKCPRQKASSDIVKDPDCEDTSSYSLHPQTKKHYDNIEKPAIFNACFVKSEPKVEKIEYVQSPIYIMKEVVKKEKQVVNNSSKWAQFVQEEQEEEDIIKGNENFILSNQSLNSYHEYEEVVNEDGASDIKKEKELFALCDDSELDNVLDI